MVHKRKLQAIVAIISIVIVGFSCKKNNKDNPANPEVYAPTFYSLQYPDFVLGKMGAPFLPADNPLTVEGIALGKKLFFDPRLSKDMTISCGSCHSQAHSFDDSSQFSLGVNGTPGDRNAMPIVNMAWNNRFFWDGRRNSLETQAHDPVINPVEMASTWPLVVGRLKGDTTYQSLFFKAFGTRTVDSDLVTKAIAQFERTLISFNSAYDRFNYKNDPDAFTFSQGRGFEVFEQFGCPSCHKDGLLTDGSFRNNGLDLLPVDSGLAKFTHFMADYGKFKVPTLRNIALTAPYMHDGRFSTLNEVVNFYARGINLGSPNLDTNMNHLAAMPAMTRRQIDDLVSFLQAITDTAFVTNMAFMQH